MKPPVKESCCSMRYLLPILFAIISLTLSVAYFFIICESNREISDLKNQLIEISKDTKARHVITRRNLIPPTGSNTTQTKYKKLCNIASSAYRPWGRNIRQETSQRLCEENKRDEGMPVGSAYIRWGRKTCSNTSQLIYEGFAAGQHVSHAGGASNHICLPLKPEWSKFLSSDQGNWIYGTEYESCNNGLFPNMMYSKNVPCAQCYVPQRSATFMIPAKRTCPDTWTKEYEGHLMTGHYSHSGAYNYQCVDSNPESIAGEDADKDGAVFYFVQANCPSTGHCPPYIHSAELTCVVCSK